MSWKRRIGSAAGDGRVKMGLLALFIIVMAAGLLSREGVIDFESGRWSLVNGEVTTHMGRKCLMGSGVLKDLEFENGVIEVDVLVSGERSYPGILFRIQSEKNYEQFYIRPHRAGLYPDTLQYTPVFNGVAGWQLYHGQGFTAAADIPRNQWLHLKMEISGSQARVYLDNAPQPALVIHELKHGISKGSIGLRAPRNKTAYFANFSYNIDHHLQFDTPPRPDIPGNLISGWQVSRAFKAVGLDMAGAKYPNFYQVFYAGWQGIEAEPTGLVDIARHVSRSAGGPDCVFARTIFRADQKQAIRLFFGYSDEVTLFFNGRKVFYGNSAYRYRDASFLGIVGRYDAVYLTAQKGLNEIFLMVKESFGGWGFTAQADRALLPPLKHHRRVRKAWETAPLFIKPESVRYDPKRDILYVTSFDRIYDRPAANGEAYTGFISKVKLNGEIENLKWVTGLHAPSGMAIYRDRLYTVERGNLVEIDIKSAKIIKRHPVPGSDFVNDVSLDSAGNLYISDTFSSSPPDSRVYKFKHGQFEVWEGGEAIERANGLFIHQDRLLVGNSGDGLLKAIGLKDKRISAIISLGAGVIDGIGVDRQGNYLVSHWQGRLYQVTPTGEVAEILDTTAEGLNIADFEYVREKNLLVIPTFVANKVVAYRLVE